LKPTHQGGGEGTGLLADRLLTESPARALPGRPPANDRVRNHRCGAAARGALSALPGRSSSAPYVPQGCCADVGWTDGSRWRSHVATVSGPFLTDSAWAVAGDGKIFGTEPRRGHIGPSATPMKGVAEMRLRDIEGGVVSPSPKDARRISLRRGASSRRCRWGGVGARCDALCGLTLAAVKTLAWNAGDKSGWHAPTPEGICRGGGLAVAELRWAGGRARRCQAAWRPLSRSRVLFKRRPRSSVAERDY